MIDLKKLEERLLEALRLETKESLENWFFQKRKDEDIKAIHKNISYDI